MCPLCGHASANLNALKFIVRVTSFVQTYTELIFKAFFAANFYESLACNLYVLEFKFCCDVIWQSFEGSVSRRLVNGGLKG